jgi:hypothetical protein
VSRGPGRVERALRELLYAPPAADTHADGLGPVGLTVAEAAAIIFATDHPTVSQKSSVHRARLHLVERGEVIDILHGDDRVIISRMDRWWGQQRPVGRPRTEAEEAALAAHAEEVHRRAAGALGRLPGPPVS